MYTTIKLQLNKSSFLNNQQIDNFNNIIQHTQQIRHNSLNNMELELEKHPIEVHQLTIEAIDSHLSQSSINQKHNCRICLSSEKQKHSQLIAPCKCCGSLRYVHQVCYFEWIKHLYDRLESSEGKQQMEKQGFQCQICKSTIKAQFKLERALVTKNQFKQICKTSISLTITIVVFLMIAVAAFSYLVYFANMTKQQLQENGSQAFFTAIGIIVVVVFFGAGIFFFITTYIWIQRMTILGLKTEHQSKK